MHAASFYGHYSLIPLLLQYGIPIDIKNVFGDKPVEEAATDKIRELLENAHKDKIYELEQRLLGAKIMLATINVKHPKNNKQIIMKKIFLPKYKNNYHWSKYADAFHGTSFQALESIAKHGLKKPGDRIDGKEITTGDSHIRTGTSFLGI